MYHIKKDGTPGLCKAQKGQCPLGGEHFVTEAAARTAYEKAMSASTFSENPNVAFERREFFTPGNEDNYTLIDTATGTVFGAHCFVMEDQDMDFDEFEANLDNFVGPSLATVKDISLFKAPLIIEPDTGTIVGVNPQHIYAVDHSKHEIDFEEILDNSRAAEETAHQAGFRLWD